MHNYKQWFSGVIAVSVLALGAMNLSSVGSRSQGYASYDRLLSKHYKRIAALEAEIGTYKHYRYFSDKADTVIGNHNPRPLTVRGGRATKNMRRDLERAMVGYEMRHNPEAVAGMHAAFECHVLNGNINSRLNQRCLKAFDTFKMKAEHSVDEARMQVAQMQPVQQGHYGHHNGHHTYSQKSQPVIEPMQQGSAPEIQPIDYMAETKKPELRPSPAPVAEPVKVEYAPIAPVAPVAEKNVPAMTSVPAEMPKLSQPKDDISVTAPVVDVPKIEAPKVTAPVIEAPKVEAPVIETPDVTPPTIEAPKLEVPEVPNIEEEKPFNPLDYVHPRLRNAAQKTSHNNAIPQFKATMPKFAKLSAPSKKLPVPSTPSAQKSLAFVEGKVTKPMQNLSPIRPHSFGIKPLGETRVPKSPLFSPLNMGSSTSKIDMSMFDNKANVNVNVKVKPHPRFVNETLKASPEVTASSLSASGVPVERYVVPFSGGGTRLSQSALREIQQIESKLQNGAYSKIRFIGHADKGGSSAVNRALSFERAAQVHDALENIIKFSDIEKTSIDGLGDTHPVKALRPEDNRNRRVVVELVR